MLPNEMLGVYTDLFADSFICAPEFIGGHRCFVITEEDKESKLNKIEVRGVPENSILLKMNCYKEPIATFKSTKGECKRCDYVILTQYENTMHVIYIEMKSWELKKPDIICQFKGAFCFMSYSNVIAEKFHNARISSAPQERYVVLYANRNNKTSLFPKPVQNNHSFPENAMYFPVGSKKTKKGFVYLRELI
ncbi:MAG: hypothetical protein FWF87_02440 [Synergistaceae bacterium]|nr:hypothetical protein [Synergistaceae bacterium]